MAIKQSNSPGTGARELDPDTAIADFDELLPAPAPVDPLTVTAMPRPVHAGGAGIASASQATMAPGPAAHAGGAANGAAGLASGTARLRGPARGARASARKAPVGRRLSATLPALAAMPFRRQLRVLLPTAVVALVLVFALLAIDSRQAADHARLTQVVGDALMHSQRLAKAAPMAIAGSADAFRQLRDSRESLGGAVHALSTGRTPGGERVASLPSALAAPVAALTPSWKAADEAASRLIAQEPLMRSLGDARKAINDANRDLLENAQIVSAHKVQSNAPAREVSAAGDLVMLTQKIAKDVNQLLLGARVNADAAMTLAADAATFSELADTLLVGNERQRIAPAGDAESRRALMDIKRAFGALAQPLGAFVKDLERIQGAKRAETSLFADSETIRDQLLAARRALDNTDAGRSWHTVLLAMLLIVALLAAWGLVQAYLSESRKRAEEAEEQRLVAERLEQEAKRTNDQNQAAILRLMNELQEVADGDLTVQATVSEDITGAIADSVNYTVEELRSLVSRINTTAEMVNEASSKAQMIASSLQAASEQQSREIRETGESVLRMAQQINDVSARASESVNVARQSLSASQEGARAVHNAIAGMNGIRDQIQETAKRIKRLGESSQEVGEIVELISDITEQTNVLALNAAIQAASAGEAGRGFTVVAEEVQRLAERSAQATKQIATLIKTIQADTQDAVAAMERSTQGVVDGTRLSDEAGRALDEIGRVSNQLAELIEGFSSTTSKQASSAGTVAQSIQRILLVTEQTSEGTLQTAGSIRQLSELAQELKRSVSRFKVA